MFTLALYATIAMLAINIPFKILMVDRERAPIGRLEATLDVVILILLILGLLSGVR